MATIVKSDLVEIKVTGYELQRSGWKDGKQEWQTCYTTAGYATPEAHSIPARYTDLAEARERLARFRIQSPHDVYRMVRDVTITEVVE